MIIVVTLKNTEREKYLSTEDTQCILVCFFSRIFSGRWGTGHNSRVSIMLNMLSTTGLPYLSVHAISIVMVSGYESCP